MKTLFVGQNSIHLKSVDSTNSYASELLRQINLPDGTLFYTFDQLNGRGQRGNTWESEPNKNVALSYVLQPKFLSITKQFLLTKVISLSVADLMTETFKNEGIEAEVKIKWPNDIYVNDRKIAGILIENLLKENLLQYSIIGIGININQTEFLSTNKATSLAIVCNKTFDLSALIDLLSEKIEINYLKLKANKIKELNESYLNSLYQLNQSANYRIDQQTIEAKITGVTESGKLIVEFEKETKEFDLKEITFL